MDFVQEDNSQSKEYKIDIQEILDYNYCPVYYKLKHNNSGLENLTQTYDKLLRNCFYSYITSLKNNSSVSIDYLTKLWGKYWIKDKTLIKLMTTPSASLRDRHNLLRKNGIESLISFHNLMKQGSQYPILINKGYSVKITDNITLTGRWEYIRELHTEDNSIFQIIKFQHKKDKFQTLMQMRYDLELTAAAYAFESMFTTPSYQVVYANIYKEKMVPSFRDANDFNILKQTVINTIKCIENNIYTISPDTKCFHCTYRNQCENYIKKEGSIL